jgi:hypothetical protein
MPVEIKELHIRMAVSGKPPEPAKGAQQGGSKSDEHGSGGGNADEIIEECVERVLQILQAKKER